jgi:hypothetical protein
MTPTMAASESVMDRLSNEILLTIMEEVTTDSVNEFADTYAALSLCLVCKKWQVRRSDRVRSAIL